MKHFWVRFSVEFSETLVGTFRVLNSCESVLGPRRPFAPGHPQYIQLLSLKLVTIKMIIILLIIDMVMVLFNTTITFMTVILKKILKGKNTKEKLDSISQHRFTIVF